jgi:3-hydroxybutyryl-CoA dehydrogenase
VIGLGTTGSAFAGLLAAQGISVVGVERDEPAVEQGRALVLRQCQASARARGLSESQTADVFARVRYTTNPADAQPADLVVEAVPENLGIKCAVLRTADELSPPETIFVTTTTGLSVTEIAAACGRMTRTVGWHSLTPAALAATSAIEVAYTAVTDERVRQAIELVVSAMDKQVVRVADRAGFISGALTMGYLNRAAAMYETGYATRDDIDAAMTLGCGLPVGPLRQIDQMGLDVVHDTLCALHERTGEAMYAPARILTRMRTGGLLGDKTGHGFYQYGTETAEATPAAKTAARPARTVGLAGSGIMATGIAEVCVRSGYPTVLAARTDVKAKEACSTVERSLQRAVRRGKLTRDDLAAAMDLLTVTSSVDDLAECDLLVEAVTEDIDIKREVFGRLAGVARPDAVLASTTSSLPVLECALATANPANVIGLHFFNPAPAMRLVEVVRTVLTSETTLAFARAFTASVGKHAAECTDQAGFIVNALLFPYLNQAVDLARRRYVSIDDIDTVMTGGCGYPMGPFKLLDFVGLDVSLAIQRRLSGEFPDPAMTPASYLEDLVAAGYLGRKSARGFRASHT